MTHGHGVTAMPVRIWCLLFVASKPCECKMYGAVCEELVVITCMNDFDGRAFGFEYRIQMPLVASLDKHHHSCELEVSPNLKHSLIFDAVLFFLRFIPYAVG